MACDWHGHETGGESPLWTLLRGTMSRRQLHDVRNHERAKEPCSWGRTGQVGPARSCGVEAGGIPLHRTKVKLRKAAGAWVSARPSAKPHTQPRPGSSGDGVARSPAYPTQRDLWTSATIRSGRWGGTNNDPPTRPEKSDRLIRAEKPGNAGGAKEATER